jgi:L-ascorbate metabolism protein UlaG (beta-lactamase superfamily)
MRHFILFPLLALGCSDPAPYAADATDVPPGTEVPVEEAVLIHPILHSAFTITWNEQHILVDPHGDSELYTSLPAADLVLLTDIHGDHLDTTALRAIDLTSAQLIAPQAVMDLLPVDMRLQCVVLANGAGTDLKGISIEAIPMYNMPDPNDPRHPKGRGNGYVLTLGDQRVYISGDTEDIPEMRALTNIDIALVCMNLPYTMTVEQAASAVLAFKPKVVYPYHYRGKDGFSDVERFKQLVNEGDSAIDVRLVEWYPE